MQRGDGVDFPIGGAIFAGAKSALGPRGRTGTLICKAKKKDPFHQRKKTRPNQNAGWDMSDGARKILSVLSYARPGRNPYHHRSF